MEYGEQTFLFSARKSQFTFKRRNMHDLRTKILWTETRTIFLSTWWTIQAAENAKAQRFWVTGELALIPSMTWMKTWLSGLGCHGNVNVNKHNKAA